MKENNVVKFISQILILFGFFLIGSLLMTLLSNEITKYFLDFSITKGSHQKNYGLGIKIINSFTVFGAFGLSSLAYILVYKKNTIHYLKLRFQNLGTWIWVLLLILIITLPIVNWLVEAFNSMHFPESLSSIESYFRNLEQKSIQSYNAMLADKSFSALMLNLILIALVPAVCEEIFFRGVLLNMILEYTQKKWWSIILVGIIFTLFHLQIFRAVPMFGLAFFLGYLVLKTGSLWYAIVYHFLNNASVVLINYLAYKNPEIQKVEDMKQMPIWIIFICIALTIITLYLFNKKQFISEYE